MPDSVLPWLKTAGSAGVEARALSGEGQRYYEGRDFHSAAAAQRRAIALDPQVSTFHERLAAALVELGQLDAALAEAEQATKLGPNDPRAHHVLGRVLLSRRQPLEAARAFRQSVRLGPTDASLVDFARALGLLGHRPEAAQMYEAALKLNPASLVACRELGELHIMGARADLAHPVLTRLLELAPDDVAGMGLMAATLSSLGRLEEAEAYRARLALMDPDNPALQSQRIFTSLYNPATPLPALVEEARAFGRDIEARTLRRTHFANSPDPERPLRIGLLSGDLCRHPVGRFTLSTFEELDQSRYELFSYATIRRDDSMVRRFRELIGNWRDASFLPDAPLEAQILADGIDILIDLSGHSGGNRLGIFARKPAPVAFTWLGYSATTGLSAIDYVLASEHVIPAEDDWQWSETPWLLPGTYLCFSRPDVGLAVAPPPAAGQGRITFGSANNINKLSDQSVELWARVLHAVPGSRLLLHSNSLSDPVTVSRTLGRFAAHGIEESRLQLAGNQPSDSHHLARYGDIDIALDTFPYSGCTTTMEALWMGVPVLTLHGDRYVARMSENILHNVGMADWIASDADAYVAKAAAFAADLEGLTTLRAGLRQRLEASPMMDAPHFARSFEAALRGMWRAWCATQTGVA